MWATSLFWLQVLLPMSLFVVFSSNLFFSITPVLLEKKCFCSIKWRWWWWWQWWGCLLPPPVSTALIKQHLSNTWSSIQEKVKQHWAELKKALLIKKSVLQKLKRHNMEQLYFGTLVLAVIVDTVILTVIADIRHKYGLP